MKHFSLLPLLFALALLAGCWRSTELSLDSPGDSEVDSGSDSDTDSGTESESLDPGCENGVWEGDVYVPYIDDLADLAGYTEVTGNVVITWPTWTDLSVLECLKSVGGHLMVENGDVLTSLDGLEALTSVGLDLDLLNLKSLTSVGALGSLTTVGDRLKIVDNDALVTLDGLSGVASVGRLIISDNEVLLDIDGLNGLVSIEETMRVSDNDSLLDCDVCELIDQLDEQPGLFQIEDNLDDSCTPVPDNCL